LPDRAIVVFGHDRPALLRRVLAQVPELDAANEFDLWCFIDGPRDDGASVALVRQCEAVARRAVPAGRLVVRGKNLGVGLHQTGARRFLFEEQGYDEVIQAEDDVELAPCALTALGALHHARPGLIGHSFMDTRSHDDKLRALHDVRPGTALVCALITGAVYDATAEVMDTYAERFLMPLHQRGRAYKWRDDDAIRAFLSDLVGFDVTPLYPTSQDATLLAACVAAGVPTWSPTVNHIRHVVDTGEHVLPSSRVGVACRETKLHKLPGAAVVTALSDPRMDDTSPPLGSSRSYPAASLLRLYTEARPKTAIQYGITPATPALLGLTEGELHTAEVERAWLERVAFDVAATAFRERWRPYGHRPFAAVARLDDALALTPGLPAAADLVLVNAPAGGASARAGARRVAPGGLLLIDDPHARPPTGNWQRVEADGAAAFRRGGTT